MTLRNDDVYEAMSLEERDLWLNLSRTIWIDLSSLEADSSASHCSSPSPLPEVSSNVSRFVDSNFNVNSCSPCLVIFYVIVVVIIIVIFVLIFAVFFLL